jgi:hypothetical protein
VSMFASQARSCVMQIHYQLATAKKGSSSITEYFQSFKAMCDNLAAVGQHFNDFESISYLLVGLRTDYDPFVTSITTRLDPLSAEEIYGHLLAHEMRIEHNLSPTEPSLPMAHLSTRAPCHGAEVIAVVAATTIKVEDPSPLVVAKAITSNPIQLHLQGPSANSVAKLGTLLLDVISIQILL